MAKAHESYDAGQFLTGSLTHFDITHADLVALPVLPDPEDAGYDAAVAALAAVKSARKNLVETASTRATVVILGAGAARIAVENNGAWTAADLQAALGGNYVVADFDY